MLYVGIAGSPEVFPALCDYLAPSCRLRGLHVVSALFSAAADRLGLFTRYQREIMEPASLSPFPGKRFLCPAVSSVYLLTPSGERQR